MKIGITINHHRPSVKYRLSFTCLSAASSQGHIYKHGSVGAMRHWLLHYLVLVKP